MGARYQKGARAEPDKHVAETVSRLEGANADAAFALASGG